MRKKELFFIIVLAFFVFLSSRAVFHKGFFRTIDDITTVRIVYLEKELIGNFPNNFPVRMAGELSNNFGYPLYLFYAPLTYYAGAFLMLATHLSSITATKYVYVFPLLFGPFAFYFAARLKMGRYGALVSSVIFTLFPYRGTNTYIRGAVAESWAIAFIPLAFAGLFLLCRKQKIGWPLFALSFFLVIISHNLVGAMFGAFSLLYGLFFIPGKKRFLLYFLLGLGLSAFYILPVIYYLKIIRVTFIDINKTYIFQTLEPISSLLKIEIGKMVWRVSGFFIYILAGGLVILGFKKLKGEKVSAEVLFWGTSGAVLYALLFEPAKFVWQIVAPVAGILQFVWRILSLLSFVIPLFFGLWFSLIAKMYLKIVLAVLVVVFSLNFLPSFKPEAYSYFYEYKPEGLCATTSWQDEYLPIWVKGCPAPRAPLAAGGNTKINVLENKPLNVKADIQAAKADDLIVNKFYFPGWHVYVDGKDRPLDWHFSIDGIFKTQLAPGNHRVEVVWRKTNVMWTSDLISVISFGALLYFFWNCRPKGWMK